MTWPWVWYKLHSTGQARPLGMYRVTAGGENYFVALVVLAKGFAAVLGDENGVRKVEVFETESTDTKQAFQVALEWADQRLTALYPLEALSLTSDKV